MPIGSEEFARWTSTLEGYLDRQFDVVFKKQDLTNGRVNTAEQVVAAHTAQIAQITSALTAITNDQRGHGEKIAGLIASTALVPTKRSTDETVVTLALLWRIGSLVGTLLVGASGGAFALIKLLQTGGH